jgi:hypothetical protein
VKFAAALPLAILISACSDGRVREAQHPSTTELLPHESPNRARNNNLRPIEKRALLGDNNAVNELIDNYEACARRELYRAREGKRYSDCMTELEYWIQIGAENGDSTSISLIIEKLSDGHLCRNKIRSLFWIKKLGTISQNEPWKSLTFELQKSALTCELKES